MEYISNDNRKFVFKFEIKNEEKLIITAQEENKNKITPDIYKHEFTKDELSDRKKYKRSFDNFDEILKQINLSFLKETATFNVNSSELVLSYLLYNNLNVDLVIPFHISTPSESIDIFSSYLSRSKSLYFRYQELLKKFKTSFKFTYVKNIQKEKMKKFFIYFL